MDDQIKIAIVDDHALFRKSLAVLIGLSPRYNVTCDASDGKDFIAQLKSGQVPQVVLMDINMPEMDGYETTAWLKANYPEIKVLALSTMDSEAVIIQMIKSGARGYILKDAEPKELRQAIEEVLAYGYFYNEQITKKIMRSVVRFTEEQDPHRSFHSLSAREMEFLKLACSELSYKDIAEQMCVSVRTIEGYKDTLCDKLGLKTRVGLVLYAIKNNIVNI